MAVFFPPLIISFFAIFGLSFSSAITYNRYNGSLLDFLSHDSTTWYYGDTLLNNNPLGGVWALMLASEDIELKIDL